MQNLAEAVMIATKEISMIHDTAFADALDAAEHLDPDAQMELIAVLNRRLADAAANALRPRSRRRGVSLRPDSRNRWQPRRSCVRRYRETVALTVTGLCTRLEEMAEGALHHSRFDCRDSGAIVRRRQPRLIACAQTSRPLGRMQVVQA